MFKTEAATTPKLLALAKTIQATLNKYLINLKNPVCKTILLAALIFSCVLLVFSRFN